jgi:hypothetical protein
MGFLVDRNLQSFPRALGHRYLFRGTTLDGIAKLPKERKVDCHKGNGQIGDTNKSSLGYADEEGLMTVCCFAGPRIRSSFISSYYLAKLLQGLGSQSLPYPTLVM